MKDKELKMADIKQYNKILYQYVLDNKIGLQDAFNLARSGIEMVSEMQMALAHVLRIVRVYPK